MNEQSTSAAVLDYWKAVELFSPQSIPRPAPNDPVDPVFTVKPELPLPWEPVHAIQRRRLPPKTSRRFQVFCGVYPLEKIRVLLEEKLGADPETFDERADGESCLFAFSTTEDGRPLFDSFVLSTCAWAAARTLDPGPSSPAWLAGFEEAARKVSDGFAERFAVLEGDAIGHELKSKGFNLGRPISLGELERETKLVAEQIGTTGFLESFEIRVRAGFVSSSKKYSTDDQDFLNSFFVKDLGKVASAARTGDLGRGLMTYLTPADKLEIHRRVDVRKSLPEVFDALAPQQFPQGRWPSKDHHPLAYSQQFAVNAAMAKLKSESGLFAVNGPPGTGKTTLLRDLIAAVVVERAIRLAKLARPEQAFSEEVRWKVGQYTRVVSTWKEDFSGFGIVIASNNNGAVENVTLETPQQSAIDSSWMPLVDYFGDFAERLIGEPAWALVAARLGNKANRNSFMNQFWYGEPEQEGALPSAESGFLNRLKHYEKNPGDWHAAVEQFKRAVASEQQLRNERQQWFTAVQAQRALLGDLTALEHEQQQLQVQQQEALAQLHLREIAEKLASEAVNEKKLSRLEHRKFMPGIVEIILTLGRAFREWRAKDKVLAQALHEAETIFESEKKSVAVGQSSLSTGEAALSRVSRDIAIKHKTLAAYDAEVKKARECLGAHLPDLDAWGQQESARELSSPWSDQAWNDARAKVFLSALTLHKAFIEANAATMRKNLQGAMDILSGGVPDAAPAKGVEAAWASLFFVIPVISTTFASFDRLFSHLGKESLGWLMIDEAGQGAPQTAAGAIWRARRTIVVGDPLQLEPVVTIPMTLQQSLRTYYQTEETWLPGKTSVQQLADRVNRWGTMLEGLDEPIWVGAPLRVHRRCDRTMFDISNKVAYDGLMVFGTPARVPLNLRSSSWLDISSNQAEGHWIPEEGEATELLIKELLAAGVPADEVFLISPFRAVVKRLRQIAERFDGVKAGTIHTVQGKEANIVILVLGGDPKRPGAKRWASAKPNLLNVAASRAKRRLYVVGNREDWSEYRFFSTAMNELSGPVQP